MRRLVKWLAWLALFAGLAVSSSKVNNSTAEVFWQKHGNWLLVAVFATAAIPFFQGLIAQNDENKRRKRLELEKKVRQILEGCLVDLVTSCKFDFARTGVQVFFVKRRPLISRHPFRRAQEKIARVRLASFPPESGVSWEKGKGVIGKCWSTRSVHFVDLGEAFGKLDGIKEEDWNRLPIEARFGLDFREFQQTGRLYGMIGVVPIIGSDRKYKGCISVDMPPGIWKSEWQEPATRILSAAAAVVAVVAFGLD
jgi:hypothetical protein